MITGCAVISKSTLKEVNPDITLDMVQSNPKQYTGQKVVWGGTVLATENRENSSEVEVLESDLSYDYSPKDGISRGRFIVESQRFLDSNVYKPNKRITVAGTVKGVEVRKIGKTDYAYPVITPIEMRLFEPPQAPAYQEMYPYGMYGPYGPFYPGPWPYYPGPYPYRYPYPSPYPYPFP